MEWADNHEVGLTGVKVNIEFGERILWAWDYMLFNLSGCCSSEFLAENATSQDAFGTCGGLYASASMPLSFLR